MIPPSDLSPKSLNLPKNREVLILLLYFWHFAFTLQKLTVVILF